MKMTTQEAWDEFFNLINDDPDFSDLYTKDVAGFQSWLDDYMIGLDD